MLQNLAGSRTHRRQHEGDALNLKASLVNFSESQRLLQMIAKVPFFSQRRVVFNALDALLFCRTTNLTDNLVHLRGWFATGCWSAAITRVRDRLVPRVWSNAFLSSMWTPTHELEQGETKQSCKE